MKKEICQGCKATQCLFRVDKCEELCPCIECLVKVMCKVWCIVRIRSLELIPEKDKDKSTSTIVIDRKKYEFYRRS